MVACDKYQLYGEVSGWHWSGYFPVRHSDGADDGVSQLAAVLGPLEPPKRLYGNEQTME